MDQRTFLAVVLALGVWAGYSLLFPPPKRALPPHQINAVSASVPSISGTSGSRPVTESKSTNPDFKAINEDVNTTAFESDITNVGGSLHRVHLGTTPPLPLTDILGTVGTIGKEYRLVESGNNRWVYVYENGAEEVRKTFTLSDAHTINVRMEIKTAGEISNVAKPVFNLFTIDALKVKTHDPAAILNEYSYLSGSSVHRQNLSKLISQGPAKVVQKADFNAAGLDGDKIFGLLAGQGWIQEVSADEALITGDLGGIEQGLRTLQPLDYERIWSVIRGAPNASKLKPHSEKVTTPVQWVGYRDHFHAIIVQPKFAVREVDATGASDRELNITAVPEKSEGIYEFTVFIGPQDIGLMKTYGQQFERIVAFFYWGFFDAIAKACYAIVLFLHGVLHSWGLTIIVFTLLAYGVSYPLTMKSMVSMRKMQTLQPRIKALQEKYKSDQQRATREIMEIYKREKVNPAGGCLLMLLQSPLYIVAYQVLYRACYLEGKSFLWIRDLTKPDRLFSFPANLPILGSDFNILPLVVGGVVYLQQHISSKSMVVTDEQQAAQQRMMKYLMPVFIGFIFYHFASSVTLYFTVFYSLSAFTQWKASKATPGSIATKV